MQDFIEFTYTDAVGKRKDIEINPNAIDTYEAINEMPEGADRMTSYPQTIIGLRDGRKLKVHDDMYYVKRKVKEAASYSSSPSPIESDINSIRNFIDNEFRSNLNSIVSSLNLNSTAQDVTSLKGLILHVLNAGIEKHPEEMTEILHDLYPNANNIELLGALERIKKRAKSEEKIVQL